jgi:hypothetical protein
MNTQPQSTQQAEQVFLSIYEMVKVTESKVSKAPEKEDAIKTLMLLSAALEGSEVRVINETVFHWMLSSRLCPSDDLDEAWIIEFFSDGAMSKEEAERFLNRFSEVYGAPLSKDEFKAWKIQQDDIEACQRGE